MSEIHFARIAASTSGRNARMGAISAGLVREWRKLMYRLRARTPMRQEKSLAWVSCWVGSAIPSPIFRSIASAIVSESACRSAGSPLEQPPLRQVSLGPRSWDESSRGDAHL